MFSTQIFFRPNFFFDTKNRSTLSSFFSQKEHISRDHEVITGGDYCVNPVVCGGPNLSFGLDGHLDLGGNFRILAMMSQLSEQWFDHLEEKGAHKPYIILKVQLIVQKKKRVWRKIFRNCFFYPGPKSVANRPDTDSKGAAYSGGQLDEMRLRRDDLIKAIKLETPPYIRGLC